MNKLLPLIFLLSTAPLLCSAPATATTATAQTTVVTNEIEEEEYVKLAKQQWEHVEKRVVPCFEQLSLNKFGCLPDTFVTDLRKIIIEYLDYGVVSMSELIQNVMTPELQAAIQMLDETVDRSLAMQFHAQPTQHTQLKDLYTNRFRGPSNWPHSEELLKKWENEKFTRAYSSRNDDMLIFSQDGIQKCVSSILDWMRPKNYINAPLPANIPLGKSNDSIERRHNLLASLDAYAFHSMDILTAAHRKAWLKSRYLLEKTRVCLRQYLFKSNPESFIAADKIENPQCTKYWNAS